MTASLAAWFSRFPEGWWGYHWAPPEPMSVVQIAGSGSIDQRLMATLWAVVSRRRSVMLASEAPQAGKTTTLSALVDFLPRGTVGVFLRGWRGDFGWTEEIGADRSYLLVNEMSDHLPIYVWGRSARVALELAGRGIEIELDLDEGKLLGVIGPTRLNYARIIPMVDYTAKLVGRLIG